MQNFFYLCSQIFKQFDYGINGQSTFKVSIKRLTFILVLETSQISKVAGNKKETLPSFRRGLNSIIWRPGIAKTSRADMIWVLSALLHARSCLNYEL